MRGFQLWVNLPARDKMTEPKYQEFAPERIPQVVPADGVGVRVIAGQVGEVGPARGPVERRVATLRGPTWQKERGPTKVAWSRSFSGTCRGEMSSESR